MRRALAPMVVVLVTTARAAADPVADAEAAVTAAAAELDAVPTSDCPALCKALSSLENATKHLCALAKPGDEADQKRCSDAKAKLEEATKRVRAKCPACAAAPPADVTQAPTAPPPPVSKEADSGGKKTATGGLDEAPAHTEQVYAVSRLTFPRFGLGIAPLRLVTPPRLLALSLDVALFSTLSIRVDGAVGQQGGWLGEVGLSPRFYVAGGFHRGLFLGLDLRYARAGNAASTLLFQPGLTLAPVVGVRLPLPGRFWVSAHAGTAFALEKEPEHRVLPRVDLTLGRWL